MRWMAVLSVAAAAYAQPAPTVAAAFDHFYNLEYDDAVAQFRQLTILHPDSAEAWNHLAQGLFYASLFDGGMMGSDLVKSNDAIIYSRRLKLAPERDADLLNAMGKARALSQARLSANARDTVALYQLGVTDALHANYDLMVRHNWIAGLADANQSRELHQEVMKIDPGDVDARLIPGMHEYMIGTLPLIVVLAARAAGFDGDRDQGLKMIQDVAEHGQHNRVDAQILLPVLYRREKRSRDGVPGTRTLIQEYPRNFLLRIELAKLLLDSGDKYGATSELDRVEALISQNAPGYSGGRVPLIRKQEAELRKKVMKR